MVALGTHPALADSDIRDLVGLSGVSLGGLAKISNHDWFPATSAPSAPSSSRGRAKCSTGSSRCGSLVEFYAEIEQKSTKLLPAV